MNLHEIYLKYRFGQGQRGQQGEETPALYFLAEILAIRERTSEELTEIHRVKLTYPGQRLIQDGPGIASGGVEGG